MSEYNDGPYVYNFEDTARKDMFDEWTQGKSPRQISEKWVNCDAKRVRRIVASYAKEIGATLDARPSVEDKARNRKMWKLHDGGATNKELAEWAGLSESRVVQILAREKRRKLLSF